jgi:hypothetical protein
VSAVLNLRSNDSRLVAVDTPLVESVDNPTINPGSVGLDSIVIPGTMAEARERVGSFIERVNEAGIAFGPQGPNSNTFAGDLFRELTGEDPEEHSPLVFPGLEDNLFTPSGPCLPVKDWTGCTPN